MRYRMGSSEDGELVLPLGACTGQCSPLAGSEVVTPMVRGTNPEWLFPQQ